GGEVKRNPGNMAVPNSPPNREIGSEYRINLRRTSQALNLIKYVKVGVKRFCAAELQAVVPGAEHRYEGVWEPVPCRL
ncbi:MAG: hypothetical protein R6V27_10270, partial [Balneolaceae bacterium]